MDKESTYIGIYIMIFMIVIIVSLGIAFFAKSKEDDKEEQAEEQAEEQSSGKKIEEFAQSLESTNNVIAIVLTICCIVVFVFTAFVEVPGGYSDKFEFNPYALLWLVYIIPVLFFHKVVKAIALILHNQSKIINDKAN